MTSRPVALATLALFGCATPPPAPPAQAYAQALEAGHLDAAYALTTPAFRAQVTPEAYQARFADPAARAARAAAVRSGLAALAEAAPELFGRDETEAPEAVILRFAAAVRAGHFEEARGCLTAALRSRYSATLLAADFRDEPGAPARLERAVLAAEGTPVQEGNRVRFPLGGGGAVVVVRETEGWRLLALE